MSIVIQNASGFHVDGIEAIEQECFSDPWSREAIVSQLPDGAHEFLVAVDGDRVVGYIGLMHVIDEGYISNVAVTAEYRRKSIGDSLICELVQRGKSLDLAFLTLEVRQSNKPAKALYGKHGFTEVGVRKNYYTKPKEDAVLMTLYLKEDES